MAESAESSKSKTPFSVQLSALSLPLLPVLISGLAHFSLIALALTTIFAGSLVYSNVVLLLVTVWSALDRKRWEPVAAFIVVQLVSALAEMIVLGVNFPSFNTTGAMRFGAAMVIINLLGRPVSLVLALVALYSRRHSFEFSLTKKQKQDIDYEYVGTPYTQAQPYSQPIPSSQYTAGYTAGSEHYEQQHFLPPTHPDREHLPQ